MAFVGTFTLSSCTKEEQNKGGLMCKNVAGKYLIENPDNPFDSVGYYHNLGLDYLLLHCVTWNETEVNSVLETFSKTIPYTSSEDWEYCSMEKQTVDYLTYEAGASCFLETANLEPILDSLRNFTAEICFSNKLPNPDMYANRIKSIEDILVQKDVSESDSIMFLEKQSLLCALAISRYSYAYWYQVAQNPLNEWHNVPSYSSKTKAAPRPFWEKVKNFFKDATTVVVDVAVTAFADCTGFWSDTKFGSTYHTDCFGNGTTTWGLSVGNSLQNSIAHSQNTWRRRTSDSE